MPPDKAFVEREPEPDLSLAYLILPGQRSHAGWVHDVPGYTHTHTHRNSDTRANR